MSRSPARATAAAHYQHHDQHGEEPFTKASQVCRLANGIVCGINHYEQFHELRWLKIHDQQRNPAPAAVDFMAYAGNQHQQPATARPERKGGKSISATAASEPEKRPNPSASPLPDKHHAGQENRPDSHSCSSSRLSDGNGSRNKPSPAQGSTIILQTRSMTDQSRAGFVHDRYRAGRS